MLNLPLFYAKEKLFPSTIHSDLHLFFLEFNRFYTTLSQSNQAHFRVKTLFFLKKFRFYTSEISFQIQPEMVWLISAKATQLTFGYSLVSLSYFKSIELFSDAFYNENHQLVKGEVTMNGKIRFSWKHFLEGISVEDDGIDLGIHEFSHALFIDCAVLKPKQRYIPPIFMRKLEQKFEFWKEHHLENELQIRSYAFHNLLEFFAVCCELFFENPNKLAAFDKELCVVITKILNQKANLSH